MPPPPSVGGGAPDEEELARLAAVEAERGVRVTDIEGKDLEKVIGSAWKTERIQRLDFSGSAYDLETLRGLSLLDKSRLNRLTYIDVSNNRLHSIERICDENGFDALTVLLARHNSLTGVSIRLSHLLELNVSYNMLKEPPDLTALPLLEVLVLANNHLSGSFQGFKFGRRLKSLDLSHNLYENSPSELALALEYLASGARNLLNLRIYANPFVAHFPEYQVFVVKALPSLIKIDDLKISRTLRASVQTTQLYQLDVYDDQFMKRKKEFELSRADRNKSDDTIGGLARLAIIIQELENIVDNPTALQRHVVTIYSHAQTLTSSLRKAARRNNPKERDQIEDVFWSSVPTHNGTYAITTSRTIELVMGIMERHESVKFPLIEILGHLTAVAKHEFGAKCMHAIGRVMLGDDLSKNQAAETLRGIVMQNLLDFCMVDVHTVYSKAIIAGVNAMLRNRGIKEKISDALKDLVPVIADKLVQAAIVDIPHLVKLLANLTETDENAREAASEKLCLCCVAAIDNKSIAEARTLRELFIDVLNLSENMVEHGPDHTLDLFVKFSTHVQVISRGKSLYDAGHCQDPTDAETFSNILNFITAMLSKRESVKHDCCESFHMVDLLCKVLMYHSIHPLVLKSACICLTRILEDVAMYNRYAPSVVEELQYLVPLLQFLDGQRYCDLYKQAILSDADEATRRDIESGGIQVPPLTHMFNGKVVDAFLGVIQLLALFAKDAENGETDEYRLQVHKFMGQADSEAKLLGLLFMPNDDVKLQVMQCIVGLPLEQIEPKEMGMLIKTIASTRNIGEGKAEEVLAYLIRMLGRLVEDDAEPGEQFRSGYATIAMSEVYQTLCRNARRDTHGSEEEEEQKLVLSREAVKYFRLCSGHSALRAAMRKSEIIKEFPGLLKLEEELHSREAADVAIEQTWIGRSTECLLACFTGPRALDPSQKVFLRVMSRIAFVLEGRTDGLQGTEPKSLKEIAADESTMWLDRTELTRQQCFQDDEERDDRAHQIQRFVELDGLNLILEMITSGVNLRDENAKLVHDGELASVEFSRIREELALSDAPAAASGSAPVESDVIMGCIMLAEEMSVAPAPPLFATKSSLLDVDEEFFEEPGNRGSKRIVTVYAVSLFFRILHALIVAAPSDAVRTKVVSQVRERRVLIRLVSLVKAQQCLACHIAAKFMRVLHYVYLELVQFGRVLDMPPPNFENLTVLSKFIAFYADPLVGLMELSTERRLEPAEEVLGVEMSRSLGTLLAAAELLRPSAGAASSRPFTSKCVQALIDTSCIKLFISFVLYEIQMDMGGGSRGTIESEFVDMVYRRKGLKEQASVCLVRFLTWCDEDLRYAVLEQFSKAEVFESQNVRPCYLMELLYLVNLGKYVLQVEQALGQHFAVAEQVHALHSQTNAVVPMLLCLHSSGLYLFCPQDAGDAAAQAGRWDPGAALGEHFARPVVDMERPLSELLALYRGYGSQLLGLEWRPRQGAPRFTLLSFQSIAARDEAAHFLHRASGSDEPSRAKMLSDAKLREATLEKAPADVLAATVATLAPASGPRLGWAKAAPDSSPFLFVLTSAAIHQFRLQFHAWSAPADAGTYFDGGDDFVPVELDGDDGRRLEVERERLALVSGRRGAAGALPPTQAVVLAPEHSKSGLRFGCSLPSFAKSKGKAAVNEPVLEHVQSCSMPLKEIEFDIGLHPDLRVQGDSEFVIRFCDDSAREQWRRALAYVCRGWGREEKEDS